MKNYRNFVIAFIVITAIITSFGCNKDHAHENGHLDINFKLVYGDSPLVLLSDYTYPSGETIHFNRLSFFLADLKLANAQKTLDLLDIDYLNFNVANSNITNAEKGLNRHFHDVELGDYNKLIFSIGVPAESNAKTPSAFPSTNPLSSPAEYWAPWQSYVFMKVEGQIDLNTDGIKDGVFAIHTGDNQAYRTAELPVNIRISKDNTSELNVIIDVSNFFQGPGRIYDIRQGGQTHSVSSLPFINQFSDNMINSFRVQ